MEMEDLIKQYNELFPNFGMPAETTPQRTIPPSSTAATPWGVYDMPNGHTVIAPTPEAAKKTTPPKRLGWENCSHFESAMRALELAVERMHREMEAEVVIHAITRMHDRQRRDGRPDQSVWGAE